MPKSQIAKRENLKLLRKLMMALAVVLLISVLMNGAVFIVKLVFDSQIQKQQEEIDRLSVAEKFKDAYDVIDKKYNYREGIFNQIHDNRTQLSQIMNTIESIIPTDVSLKKLDIGSDGNVSIEGTGDSTDSVLDFYHSLKTSGLSDSIAFNTVAGTLGDPKGLNFAFTFNIKGGK